MTSEFYAQLFARVRGEVLCTEPMVRHTALRVGGPADFFVTPADLDDLRELVAFLDEVGSPYLVIGNGYNLLVRDGGFRGVVISLARLKTLELVAGGRIRAGAGVPTQLLVRFAREQGLAGIEFLCGIPGSIGGAVAMNAGAHGWAILDRVTELATLRGGAMSAISREQLRYGYRNLELGAGEIVVAATFLLEEDDPGEIGQRIATYQEHREQTQKVGFPSAGSFFKNPGSTPAWRLIDEAGFRGARVGGAQVSEVHANFLVNRGGATAADFLELAARIKDGVRQKTGTTLEEEVRVVGDE